MPPRFLAKQTPSPIEVGQIEIVTDLDRVSSAYDQLLLDDLLRTYALSGRRDTSLATDIERSLDFFGQRVARIASWEADLDLVTVRGAFERFYDGMDKAANAKYGPERPRTTTGLVLTNLGLKKPIYRQHFSRLDDRYWDKQFREQYDGQAWVKRQPDETELDYAGRYIGACLRFFPWAYFSHI